MPRLREAGALTNVTHRHEDLRYLHSNGRPFARAAIRAYGAEAGAAPPEDRVERLHVLSAFLRFMFVRPDAPRFAEIVSWTTAALHGLAPEWAA